MSSDLQPPSSRAAERLAAIVDAAEREARARADRIVADRLREEADRLDGGVIADLEPRLRKVERRPEDDEDRSTPEDDDERGRVASPVAAVASPKTVGQNGSSSAAARLLATQMAVSGSSRVEIEERLRNGFEIEDASEILDAILGPED
jgi:hypothetical protein